MQIKQQYFKFIQIILELAIPILGLIWWNWTFYFILLYCLLDFLAFIITTFYKDRKIQLFKQDSYRFPFVKGLITASLLIANFIIAQFFLQKIGINIPTATLEFLVYKDMGISQAYVLIPLVILTAYMSFKNEFILSGHFQVITIKTIWKDAFIVQLFTLIGTVFFLLLSYLINLPEIAYTTILLSAILLYKLVGVFYLEKTK